MGKLDGRVALITGAARGQGRSHALRFAREGAAVILVDICGPVRSSVAEPATPEDLDETVAAIEATDGAVHAGIADTRDRERLAAVIEAGVARFGTIDSIVANAGVAGAVGTAFEIDPEDWAAVVDTNLTGVWNTVQLGARGMVERRSGGSIVITSSLMGLKGTWSAAAYVASKHGAVGLMRALAHDFAEAGVRVNTVHPSNVLTPMIDNETHHRLLSPGVEDPTLDDAVAGFASMNLIPRPWVDSEDVTDAVLWLSSDDAKYVTGVTLPVDLGAFAK